METITITIDEELAREYIRQYRKFNSSASPEALDDASLLQAFVHDRLREETEFITKEND
jgi:hypothetical protein